MVEAVAALCGRHGGEDGGKQGHGSRVDYGGRRVGSSGKLGTGWEQVGAGQHSLA